MTVVVLVNQDGYQAKSTRQPGHYGVGNQDVDMSIGRQSRTICYLWIPAVCGDAEGSVCKIYAHLVRDGTAFALHIVISLLSSQVPYHPYPS
jgi:hypothetical protein